MTPTPLVEAVGLGVSFVAGSRRDDVQAATYRALSSRGNRKLHWALRDVTFSASAGQCLGLIGHNGAGKTTLCRALAGLIRPDAGRVTIGGQVSALLSLGTGFNTELSGRENIVLNGLMLGLSRREVDALVPRIIEFAGVGRFIDQTLTSYSAGMKARLGFSIAAMLEPEILVLDETLSVGDMEFTARAGERLRDLMKRASLLIVASHQLDFVTTYCTDVLWLEAGGIRAFGAPDDVVRQYRDSTQKSRPALTRTSRSPRPDRSTDERAITVRDVSVQFNLTRAPQFLALDAVSFSVAKGEVVGIVGRNGAGKTTLCRALVGVLKPDSGDVSVEGRVTALLTLTGGLHHQLSGRDNIFRTGVILGLTRRRVREMLDEIVAFSELGSVIDEPVKHYSRGMRARLAFSTVTAIEPDVLVIDEALTAGDAAFAAKAAARIDDLMARAAAVIVVTHNLSFVETVCTRGIWLEGGRLAFDGPPGEAVSRYRLAGGRAGKRRVLPPLTTDHTQSAS